MTEQERLEKAIPLWEQAYKNRQEDPFKLMQDQEQGKYLVATKDIEKYDIVLVDDLLVAQPHNQIHPSLQTDAEFKQAIRTQQEITKKYGHIKRSEWPEKVKRQYNRVSDLNSSAYLLESPNVEEIWKLEDSRREAQVGDVVMIDGLKSQSGKKLNGQMGKIAKADNKDSSRLGVQVFGSTGTENALKSIKQCNLKTLSGIFRTNGYRGSAFNGISAKEEYHMGALACRINHACMDASNVSFASFSDIGKTFVVAVRKIAKGDQIVFDYKGSDRGYGDHDCREELKKQYGFWCQCAMHQGGLSK